MKHGTHAAWLLLPGDRLPEGAVVRYCIAYRATGLVRVGINRRDGSSTCVRIPREMPVEVNVPR